VVTILWPGKGEIKEADCLMVETFPFCLRLPSIPTSLNTANELLI
jgi:hypothetical protein